jgi:hypothetical protein
MCMYVCHANNACELLTHHACACMQRSTRTSTKIKQLWMYCASAVHDDVHRWMQMMHTLRRGTSAAHDAAMHAGMRSIMYVLVRCNAHACMHARLCSWIIYICIRICIDAANLIPEISTTFADTYTPAYGSIDRSLDRQIHPCMQEMPHYVIYLSVHAERDATV